MTSIGSPSPFFFGGKKAYAVDRSLRFNHGDSPYLSFTPSSTGNQKVWTFSAWIKKTAVTNDRHYIYSANDSNSAYFALYFDDDELYTYFDPGNNYGSVSGRKFRDVGAWFHIVHQVDAANTTQRIWINGTEMSLNSSRNPGNNNYPINQASKPIVIGKHSWGSDYYIDMYLAEVHYSDGNKYEPTDFAETDSETGQWIPKSPSITYGTNGFYLNFSDNSGTTATTMGKDSSGNGNNFTPNNLAVSDAMKDSPTNNFATMNPLNNYSGLSQGNLRFNNYNDSAGNRSVQASIALPKSGKWYWEARYSESSGTTTTKYFGVSQIQMNTGYVTAPYVYYDGGSGILRNGNASDNVDGKQVWYNGTGVPAVLAIAVDVDNNSVEYFHNGSSQGTIPLPTLTSSQEYFFTWANTSGGSSGSLNDTFNFGADSTFQGQETSGGNTDANGIGDFKYAPPSGHLALCSANLPDPTIKLPNKHFGTILYTGTGSSNSVSDSSAVDFTPDWVWIKKRSNSENHELQDAVRGATKRLASNSTAGESTIAGSISSFNSNGFTVVDAGTTNESGETYVGWNWNAGDSDGKTYIVKVVDDSGNKYRFDNFGTSAVTLDLAEGGTYIFNMDDASNASHPFSIGTAANGTVYTSGITYFLDGVSKTYSEYTSGFAAASTRRLHITVPASAPVLYYWCSAHSGMGSQINTNTSLGSSNFDGTIQTTVKTSPTAGFSIMTYTGTGSAGTCGHGLGVKPDVIITKRRDGSGEWTIYHKDLEHSSSTSHRVIRFKAIYQTGSSSLYYGNDPTSTVQHQAAYTDLNGSGETYVAYCFSGVEGYSKHGLYYGNSNDNGPFVYTGFSVSWLLVKRRDGSTNWCILDNKRDPDNVANTRLFPNSSSADSVSSGNVSAVDFLSNGFKVRDSHQDGNSSSGEYIYLAFAESPFKNARAR